MTVLPLAEILDGFVDLHLIFRVGGTGGLVQNQDRGIFQDGPCNGDALLFAAGEPGTEVAHLGVVAIRQGT